VVKKVQFVSKHPVDLSKEEIERMKKDAEVNAESDLVYGNAKDCK
jgi:molecular chaperone DnaK (HSP70)